MLFDVDILCASKVVETLAEFVFSEDVALTDITDRAHRLAIHGHRAIDLLKAASQPLSGPPLSDFAPGQATIVKIAGHDVVVDRQDATGDVGLELSMHVEHALAVWNQLSEHADRLNETNAAGQTIGVVTSGGFGPTVNGPVAQGYVDTSYAKAGTPVKLLVRGKLLDAEIATLPFVPAHYKR